MHHSFVCKVITRAAPAKFYEVDISSADLLSFAAAAPGCGRMGSSDDLAYFRFQPRLRPGFCRALIPPGCLKTVGVRPSNL
jgi:hypothetical protein